MLTNDRISDLLEQSKDVVFTMEKSEIVECLKELSILRARDSDAEAIIKHLRYELASSQKELRSWKDQCREAERASETEARWRERQGDDYGSY